MSPEVEKEVAECRRKADEYKQRAETASIAADKELYVYLEDSFRRLVEAYEQEARQGQGAS